MITKFPDWIIQILDSFEENPVFYENTVQISGHQLLDKIQKISKTLPDLRGQIFLLSADTSIDLAIGILALSLKQAIILPLTKKPSNDEVARITKQVSASSLFEIGVEGTFTLTKISSNFSAISLPAAITNDTAFIRFSSGTSGAPKAACVSSLAAQVRAFAAEAAFSDCQNETISWLLPLEFHFIAAFFGCLKAGIAIRFIEGPQQLLSAHSKALYCSREQLISLENLAVKGISNIYCAGSILTEEQKSQLEQMLSAKISSLYGAIEVGLALKNGVPLPGYQVSLLPFKDSNFSTLNFKSAGLFSGYTSTGSETENTFTGWFNSGDLASENSDGSYQVFGRASSAFVVAGEVVFPEKLEAKIRGSYGVREVLVSNMDGVVVAELEMQEGVDAKGFDFKTAFENLPELALVKSYQVVNKLIQTASGKVSRRK